MMTNGGKIDKQHVATAALFAIKYIPHADQPTLHKLLELVNTTGSIGWITEPQLLAQMQLLLKYVPGICANSLLIVLDLLNVCVPLNPSRPPALPAPQDQVIPVNWPQSIPIELQS
jgi:hypothetical protein